MWKKFSRSLWLQILIIALANDFIDLFGQFPNPVETALDLLTGLLIVLLIKMKTFEVFQPKIVNKIISIFTLLVIVDLLPFIDVAPLWTLATLALYNDFYRMNLLFKTYNILNNLSKILIRNPVSWSYITCSINRAGDYLREISRLVSREVRKQVLILAREMTEYAAKYSAVKEEYPSEEEARSLVILLDSWLGKLISFFE